MTDSEEQAIRLAQDGDTTEFQVLLLSECRWLADRFQGAIPVDLQPFIDVDDVLQETCLRAIRDCGNLEWKGRAAFHSWLNEIAKNSLIDLIRAGRRRKRGGDLVGRPLSWLDVTELLRASSQVGEGERPSGNVHRQELIVAVQRAVEALPPREREAVRLVYIKQFSVGEAAESLNMTEGAIRAVLQRARNRLRKVFRESAW